LHHVERRDEVDKAASVGVIRILNVHVEVASDNNRTGVDDLRLQHR